MRIALSLVTVLAVAGAALAQDVKPWREMGAKVEAVSGVVGAIAKEGRMAEAPAKGLAVPEMKVVTRMEMEGGLVIEEMKVGEGDEVKAGGAVVLHYHETLAKSGSEFDSSYRRGEPVAVSLGSEIAGWQKGIPGMRVGGIRRITVPAAMANAVVTGKTNGAAAKSATPVVPVNEDVVFVVQVVDAVKIEEVKVGMGDEVAGPRCVAITAYTITGADGKVIERRDAGDPYIWVAGEYRAMAVGIEGMRSGGKRKITVPAAFNTSDPKLGPARAGNVPVVIEVELLNVRNVPERGGPEGGC